MPRRPQSGNLNAGKQHNALLGKPPSWPQADVGRLRLAASRLDSSTLL